MSKLKKWLREASNEQRAKLAKLAGTSRMYIRHVAAGRKTGTAEFAAKIERASEKIENERANYLGMIAIRRGDIAEVCRKCPYYQKACGGKK